VQALTIPPSRTRIRPVEPLHDSSEGGSDESLVLRARAGDTWALEMLYRRHVGLIASTAQRLLRQRSETEDVVQETFLLAFEKLDQLAVPAAFRGWLVRIAVSRVHRRFRWRRVRSLFGLRRGNDDAEDATFEAEATNEATPEQRAELALLDRALATMPLALRTAWVLRHVVGCSNDEVANACGCSLATIKRRIGAADALVRAHAEGVR
jgi:RNA polymerase sigma-70 factor (ECF subfamily)